MLCLLACFACFLLGLLACLLPGIASSASLNTLCGLHAPVSFRSDVFENIGIERNDYLISLNNRNLLDALLDQLGLNSINDSDTYLTVMRSR